MGVRTRDDARRRHAVPALVVAVSTVILLLVGGLGTGGVVRAASLDHADASHAAPATSPAGHITILVLDMSGSMGRPGQGGNDPNGLRCSAAHAYIDLSGAAQWVGIVGLTHPAGAPGDSQTAQDYAQPAEMSTDAARAAMRQALDTHSNNCIGDGTTPMADALARADHMLQRATQGGTLSGSVVLLTDGLPDPNAAGQIATIHTELPDFTAHNWPIDTIALGDADRDFLRGLADSTGGTAYDVANGPVSGISPLNLEPFFIDIFRVNAGRTLLHAVAPMTLGGPIQRQFHVGRFIAHMDVLVVRDSANVAVQLYAPGNYPNTPVQPGQARIVESDPHYAIFSIDAPVRGDWVLSFSGSGQLLADALLQSTLSLQLVSPQANQHLPIGLALAMDASLRDGQDQVLAEPVTVTATVGPANGTDRTSREVPLADPGGSSPTGNYQGRVTIPSSAPRGTYHVTLQAQLNDASVSLIVPVVFEAFPLPTLLAPSDGKPQLAGLSLGAVPGAPLTVAFGLTVDGKLQAEPGVRATLAAGGQNIALSAYAGTWQGTYVPTSNGIQPLTVRLTGTYHGTDLAPWTYTLPLQVTLGPTLAVSGLDARRPYPAHRTVTVTLAYFRQAGVPDPTAAGHLTVLLLPPDGIGIPLALQPRLDASGQPEPGSFTAALAFADPGTYMLHATFDDGVPGDHSEQIYVLRVIDFPTAVTAPMGPGQLLTAWGPLSGLYSLPVVSWLAGPPLAGLPSQPTAFVRGQVLLAGQPYTGGALQAAAYAVGSDRPLPAAVTRNGAAYTVSFRPPAQGAYRVVVTWVGDFAGLRADQEPTANLLQLSIVGPSLGGWTRAWLVTLIYLLLLALAIQLGRFGATPAPAGALQASDRPDDLYDVARHRGALWRRFLWRNRVRTADLGLPPGAELWFRRYRGPQVVREPRAAGGATVLVGGAELRPGGAPVELEGASLTFRQASLSLSDDLDDLDDLGTLGRRNGRTSRARSDGGQEGFASSYAYLSRAELRERNERDDPFGGLVSAVAESGDAYDDGARVPTSLLGHVAGLFALLRPLPRARAEEDEFGGLWLDMDEPRPARGRRGRRGNDPLDDLEIGAPASRGRRSQRATDAFDDADDFDVPQRDRRRSGRTSRRSRGGDDLDRLDDYYDGRGSRGRSRARDGALDDGYSAGTRRRRRAAEDDDLY